MKTRLTKLGLLRALAAGLGLILRGQAMAQTFTTLYNFTPSIYPSYENSDGDSPQASLILSSNTLYGTAEFGGNMDFGTVFAVNINGTDFTALWTLDGNSAGYGPESALILSSNTLFGTVPYGYSGSEGVVFAVNIESGTYIVLHNFPMLSGSGGAYGTNSDGANPYGGLVLSNNTLYGTAFSGGNAGWGTVFAVNINGTGFTNLHSFTGGSQGADPYGGLVLSGNTLYGTTSGGFSQTAPSGYGTVFAINTDGTGFTNLHIFPAASKPSYINSDGAQPYDVLLLSGNVLYGTAYEGGNAGWGTVFALNTDGSAFTRLYSFTNGSDGSQPWAGGLILSGNTLYGMASRGGSAGSGTVFSVSTTGTNFATLHSFAATVSDGVSQFPARTNSDGYSPDGGLILSGNTLYGTAEGGGTGGSGTIFSISLPPAGAPQLAIMASGTNVILSWPTYATGFVLESATNLVSPVVWNTNLPSPVTLNGNNTVTNAISSKAMFYRLIQ